MTTTAYGKDWGVIAGLVLRMLSSLPPGHQALVKFDGLREANRYTVMLWGSDNYLAPRNGDDLAGMLRMRLAMLPADLCAASSADEASLAEVLAACDRHMATKAVASIHVGRNVEVPGYTAQLSAPWSASITEDAADVHGVVEVVRRALIPPS